MKGIIIAAGYGTRFLPATKTVPKEMFPLIDTPAIDFIIDEFIESGINEILIVTSRRKKALDDYFDREVEMEQMFSMKNDAIQLDSIKPREAQIYFTRQMEMKGTGHAIMSAKAFLGKEPCIIAYPDDIVFSTIPLAKQMIGVYEKTGASVLAVEEIDGDVSRYGVVDIEKKANELMVNGIVEKPVQGTEPSKMISVGRYLFTHELFALLEEDYKKHVQGEFYHINAINALAQEGKLYACNFQGKRIDVGDKLGYLEGLLRYSLMREDLKNGSLDIIKKIYEENL